MPLYRRLRNVFRTNKLNRDLESELNFHLAETVDRLVADGVPQKQAQRQAARLLGNYTLQKERTRDMDVAGWLDAARADVTYGLRQLRLNPGFTAVAVLSLALGIGANTAIFQLLDAVRLRGLPVKEPSQLATLVPAGNDDDYFLAGSYSSREQAFSYSQLEEFKKRQQAFSGVLTFWPNQFNLSESGQSRFAEGILISSNYLDVLGVSPMAGSAPPPQDDKAVCNSAPALLGYGFWQREFGGSFNAIGQTISLNGHRFPIGGIMPPSFFGVEPGQRFDVALPLCADNVFAKDGKGRAYDKMSFWLTPIARLKPEWSVERASAHVTALSPVIFQDSLPADYRPDMAKAYTKNGLKAIPASAGVSPLRRQFASPLWILLAISGSVLLIACANLANLLLARASAREREIAVRQAVGASRLRIVLQLLTESLLLAGAGAVLGMCLAQGLSHALVSFLNGDDGGSISMPSAMNWHVFGFLAGLAILTCLLFGLAPSLRASAGKPAAAMRGGRSSTSTRERNALRGVLVVTQVALSLVLLVAAMLFGRSLQKLLAINVGFDSRNVLVAHVQATGPLDEDKERQKVLFRELEQRIVALSETKSVAKAAFTPFSGFGWNDEVQAGENSTHQRTHSWFNRIGPGYLTLMGTPLLAGRDFDSHDDLRGPKVAIVNESFAKSVFGGKNPVGRTFRVEGLSNEQAKIYQIVGLAADTRYNDLREPAPSIVFFPTQQDEHPNSDRTFVIRGRGSLDSLQGAVQREMTNVSGNFLVTFHVLDIQIKQSVMRERLMANLSLAFGFLAASLSALGLYGVMSYIVTRRRSEIGVRFALGATPGIVYRLIARDAATMVGIGLLVGLGVSIFLSRYAESLLFELRGRDPVALVLAVALLAFTAAVATFLPARRAARLEPITALREE